MSTQVWLITGAGRGMGADFARAALAAGHSVVATGRNADRIQKTLGESPALLAVMLDVTSHASAVAAAHAAVDRFGRIDVLVNNAASFFAGYFEELTPTQIDQQLATSLVGPMDVTRAILPVMRKQRSGHIISISSSAGIAAGFDFVSAYAASKFGLEGWMESLRAEIAPVRHPCDGRQSGILPHRAPHRAVNGLRCADHRRLRRAQGSAHRILEVAERHTVWRPGEACGRSADHRDADAAAAPVHRRCGRHCGCRAKGRGPEG